MYLLARVIKSMGIKMVLSGEGADEVFGGYLYFHKAPSARDFHEETVRKLSKLHLYDCLRANKSLSAWGVEGRVPFLDKEFLDVAMRTNPEAKMCPGKRVERGSFKCPRNHTEAKQISVQQLEWLLTEISSVRPKNVLSNMSHLLPWSYKVPADCRSNNLEDLRQAETASED